MKLGGKDYWQVGDEVYCQVYGKGFIKTIEKTSTRFPLCVIFNYILDEQQWFASDGIFDADLPMSLFHLGAITFDEQDRPISINYDYVPDRTPKVMVTKLPHEFVEGEEVLVKGAKNQAWTKAKFIKIKIIDGAKVQTPYYRFLTLLVPPNAAVQTTWVYCIPYAGNEHCHGKVTNCESGEIPNYYTCPNMVQKKEWDKFSEFQPVLVRNLNNFGESSTWKLRLFKRVHLNAGNYYAEVFAMRKNNVDLNNTALFTECIPLYNNTQLLGK